MKKDNKGFSLVELIVVVAIMALLMTIVAPVMLRYVEKTRLQKDNSAIAEIANAMKLAAADEAINKAIKTAGGITITIGEDEVGDKSVSYGSTVLDTEVAGVMPSFTTESNTYNASDTQITLKITVDASGKATVTPTGMITVAGQEDPDGTQPTL